MEEKKMPSKGGYLALVILGFLLGILWGALSISPYNKMSRDNFPERELKAIAEALDCDCEVSFIMRDTGESI